MKHHLKSTMKKIPSITKLREICYPKQSQKKDPYRKFGIYLVKPLLYTSLTPNWITTIRLIFLCLGFFFFIPFYFTSKINPNPLLGVIIFEFCILLDTFDGAIARYKNLSSKFGEYYDFIIDHISATLFYFLALGLFVAHTFPSFLPLLLLTVLMVALANLAFFMRVMYTVGNISQKDHERKFLFRLFYQDNGRLIVNALLIAILFSYLPFFKPFTPYYLLIGFFILFLLGKMIYLIYLFIQETKRSARKIENKKIMQDSFSLIFKTIKNIRKK